MDGSPYIMLVSSLPHSERLFKAKQPPLSRERLDRRLGLMSGEDQACLIRIERLLSWDRHALEETSEEAIALERETLQGLPSEALRALVRERLEMRTLLAALRQRAFLSPQEFVGHGSIARRIRTNWSAPTFALEGRYPWLTKAHDLHQQGDTLALERLILETTLQQLQRRRADHRFDFEAVVIYVLTWSIYDRWAKANAVAAAERFKELAAEGLKAIAQSASKELSL